MASRIAALEEEIATLRKSVKMTRKRVRKTLGGGKKKGDAASDAGA